MKRSGKVTLHAPIIEVRNSKVSADSFEDERTGGHYFEIE